VVLGDHNCICHDNVMDMIVIHQTSITSRVDGLGLGALGPSGWLHFEMPEKGFEVGVKAQTFALSNPAHDKVVCWYPDGSQGLSRGFDFPHDYGDSGARNGSLEQQWRLQFG